MLLMFGLWVFFRPVGGDLFKILCGVAAELGMAPAPALGGVVGTAAVAR